MHYRLNLERKKDKVVRIEIPAFFLFSYLAFSVHSSAVLCWSNVSKQNIVFST